MIKRIGVSIVVLLLFSAGLVFATGQTEKQKTTGGAQQKVKLTVWYLSQSPEEINLIQSLNKKFEKAHPGVTIDFSPYSFDAMIKSLKLALSSGTGPDVAYAGASKLMVGTYAGAGYLVDLTNIAKERGWTKHYSPGLLKLANMYTKGEGSIIWGFPFDVATLGVFYNSSIYNKLGLKAPETFDALEKNLTTIKSAGITPFSVGGLDKWPLNHYFFSLVTVALPFDEVTNLQTLNDKGTWDLPGAYSAAKKLREWIDKGYFNKDILATSYNDANNLFITGKVAMNLGGTWNNATFVKQAKFTVRFFPLPRLNPNISWHMAGYQQNNLWIISKSSKHQKTAVDYLDYMLGKDVALALWNSGDLPAYKFATIPKPTSQLQRDVYSAMQKCGIGYFFLQASPQYRAKVVAIIQDMAAKRISPEEAIKRMDKAYKDAVKAAGK